MSDTAISFSDVSVQYAGRVLIQNFSKKVERGSTIVLKGASGSGKTTLLHLILGYQQPETGAVSIFGEPITDKTAWAVRRHCAFVSQNISLPDCISEQYVREYVTFAGQRYDAGAVTTCMESLMLAPTCLSQPVRSLSGGERQRLALVVALLLERPILLLDEVTASVDGALKQEIASRIAGDTTRTVVAISHDTEWYTQPQVHVWDMDDSVWMP